MGVKRYRLEIAIKKVRGVAGLRSDAPKTAVVVQFLDFPDVVIYPLGDASPNKELANTKDVRYSVSHKADFLLDDVLKQCVFPTQCFCTFAEFTGKDKARAIGRWTTVCPYVSSQRASDAARSYQTVAIRNSNGEPIGSVEMSSRVVLSPDTAGRPPSSVLGGSDPDASLLRVAQGLHIPEPVGPSRRAAELAADDLISGLPRSRGQEEQRKKLSLDQQNANPQTIRVVVRDQRTPPPPSPLPGERDPSAGAAVTSTLPAVSLPTHSSAASCPPPPPPPVLPVGGGAGAAAASAVAAPPPPPPPLLISDPVQLPPTAGASSNFPRPAAGGDSIIPASVFPGTRSLLAVLRYDVAYQLQSTSETLAATLKREEEVLCISPFTNSGKGLLHVIDKRVQRVLKISNIVLQIANRLSDKPSNGTFRDVTDEVHQRYRRNPINKLKTPVEKSIGYYLMFDVLFQLQCVETHLSYLLETYAKELDVPINTIDPAAVSYCTDFEKQVQGLIKYANILVQSAIDGRLGKGEVSPKDLDCSFSSGSASSEGDHRPTGQPTHRHRHHHKKRQSPKDEKKDNSPNRSSKKEKKHGKKKRSSSRSSSSSSSGSSSSSSSSVEEKHRSSKKKSKHHRKNKHEREEELSQQISVPGDISAVLPPSARDHSRRHSLPISPLRASTTASSSGSTMPPGSLSALVPPPAPPPAAATPVIYQWNTTVTPGGVHPGVVRTTTSSATPHPATTTTTTTSNSLQRQLETFSFGQPVTTHHHHPNREMDYSSDSDFDSASSSSSTSSSSSSSSTSSSSSSSGSRSRITSTPISSRYSSANASSRIAVLPLPQPAMPSYPGAIVKNPPGYAGYTPSGLPPPPPPMPQPPPPPPQPATHATLALVTPASAPASHSPNAGFGVPPPSSPAGGSILALVSSSPPTGRGESEATIGPLGHRAIPVSYPDGVQMIQNYAAYGNI